METIRTVLEGCIRDATRTSVTRWREPVIGIADARDPRFRALPGVAADDHFMPEDLLPGAAAVVVFFVPFAREVIEGNIEGRPCSVGWVKAYIETNDLIGRMEEALEREFAAEGFRSAAVQATHNFDERRLVSRWSHRHVAEIAGIGKMGLNNMLITEKGCAGRLGSIVTDKPLEPTRTEARERCLYRLNGSCKKCVYRCIGKALTVDGFDRHACYRVCLENADRYRELGLADICGKCMVDVPCAYYR